MFASVLSLIAAAAYGVGDFFGAIASKRSHPIWVSFISHAFYASSAALALLFMSGVWSGTGVLVGFGTGSFEAIGFLLFYFALTYGPVAIVAPLVSVIYSVVPVVIGLALGDSLSVFGWVGVVMALGAVVALSVEPGSKSDRASVGFVFLAVVAGVTWGLSTVILKFAPADSGITPIVIGGATAFGWLVLVMLFTPHRLRGEFVAETFAPSALSGVMFAAANVLILLALRAGDLALVGVLTSLYPMATVLLARFILKEQINAVQWLGIGLAIFSAGLLSLG